ncbi:MAG: nucleotidyl transferase AbiEii/AbiGii toxin family protein [Parcubacteria group bacterium]
MISFEEIEKLAKKYQTTRGNILREYFQHLFLSYFYRQKEAGKIYFKGGTALRLIYKSPRFSEDLDFETTEKNIKPIEQAVAATLAEIEKEGIEVEILEAKKTTDGYLAIVQFKTTLGILSIQLEISRRPAKNFGEAAVVAGDFIPPYAIQQLREEDLVKGKIDALLDRKKPRDFYDLYFILRAGLLPVEKRGLLKEISKLLSQSKVYFERELRQFLPKDQQIIIKNFKKVLEKEVGRFI